MISPIGQHITVEPLSINHVSAGGLRLNTKPHARKGKVLQVSPDVVDSPVSPGEIIIYNYRLEKIVAGACMIRIDSILAKV